eukprot:CAMPEP_0201552956 /NCGR_PEP_ID=MMETSP0173_2-20130828/19363_1 /ASSEMBLY_ACC=CAM_ASM_000268 /TAXON_ID=218659 /ORGANISM="Vexillifera sp., Strain DIVA3 564/2" /LENGTH=111 /DNA_ID=CAMNT_0047963549 /DNA_START=96 /DNA_END=428 /DNA_ORIENTATION=-
MSIMFLVFFLLLLLQGKKGDSRDYVAFAGDEPDEFIANSEYNATRQDLQMKYGRKLGQSSLSAEQIRSSQVQPDNLGKGYKGQVRQGTGSTDPYADEAQVELPDGTNLVKT